MSRTLMIFLLSLLIPAHATAFSVRVVIDGVPTRWENPVIEYYLQQAGSDDLTPEQSLAAVRTAFKSIQDLTCAVVSFTELGDAPNPNLLILAGHAPNGLNELAWLEDDKWTMGKWVLGVTSPIIGQDGLLHEADIAFNGLHLKWSITGKNGTDLESVAVHEIGHMIGMQHNLGPYSWKQPPTMAPNIAPNNKSRTLEKDDQNGVCFLYPVDEGWSCENDTECPMIVATSQSGDEYYSGAFTCDLETHSCADTTILVPGIAGLGEACEYASACVDDLVCQAWKDESLCTVYCKVDEDTCPEDFSCLPFAQFPLYGACIPDSGEIFKPGEGPDGCQSSIVCEEGKTCLPLPSGEGKLCTTICDLAGDDCPEGEVCYSYGAEKTMGACFAAELVPGAEPEPTPEPSPELVAEPEVVASDVAADSVEVSLDSGPVDIPPADLTPSAPPEGEKGTKSGEGCAGAPASPAGPGFLLLLLSLLFRRRVRV